MRRNQFGFAAEAARVWAWVWDIASDRLEWAISPDGLLGPKPASGKWPDFRDMLHPDDRAGFVAAGRAAVEALSRTRRHVSYEAQFRVVRTDGSVSGYRWGVERKRVLLEREHNSGHKQDHDVASAHPPEKSKSMLSGTGTS